MAIDRYINIVIWDDNNNSYSVEDGDFSIASGTLALNEIIADGNLEFGQLCSNKFECELYFSALTNPWYELTTTARGDNINTEDNDNLLVRSIVNPNLEGLHIKVENKSNSGATTTSLFVGTIDSATTDNYNYHRKIVAYDNSYILKNTNVVDIYNNYFEQVNGDPTLSGLRSYLCTQLSITTVSPGALPNDSLVLTKGAYASMTFGDLISSICQIQCCFPNFNRSGNLEFVKLGTTVKNISAYETGSSTFEDYNTHTITGIKVFSTSDSLSQQYPTNDPGANPLPISGNFLLLDLLAGSVQDACYNIYNAVNAISYKPCNIQMIVSDLGIPTEDSYQNLLLGDYVHSDKGYHYILEQDISGSVFVNQSIKCSGDEYYNDTASTKNDILATNHKFSSFEQTLDHITTQVGDMNSSLTELSQTSSSISGKVTVIENTLDDAMEDGKIVAAVVKTEQGFTFDANGLTISEAGSDITTNIDEEGMTVSKGSTALLTAKSEQGGTAGGVETYRLKANGYLSIGDYSRFMDYTTTGGQHRTGCFWVEEN